MGLTTSLFTAQTGLKANSEAITVTGDNIANVNTTAFKGSQLRFETQISQNLKFASGPTADLGGRNPLQVGLGVRMSSNNKNMTAGQLQTTGVNTDLAVDGNGFFVLDMGNDIQRYTRDGTFTLDSNFNLVNSNGGRVQGYPIDDEFNVLSGTMEDIQIPIGAMTIAQESSTIRLAGNLNSGGDTATQGSVTTSNAFNDTVTALPATLATSLVNLEDATTAASAFALGDVITISGATKGGATMPDHTFEVGAANTTASDDFGTSVQDLMDFFEDIFGIDTALGGALTMSAAGEFTVTSNTGTVNEIVMENQDLTVNQGVPTSATPFTFTQSQQADGESVRTTFVAYDSLGNAHNVDLSLVLETKTNGGTQWRYYAEAETDTDLDRRVGSGTIDFDNDGRLSLALNNSFTITLDNNGTTTPLDLTLQFDDPLGPLTALSDTVSQVSAINVDGAPIGTLEDFSVGADGLINGQFTNGLIRSLGQVVLADFANAQGLQHDGGNLFAVTANSGLATIEAPGTSGTGTIVGGALEMSNVEISQEFINLIGFSTGFSANSRVLTTSDRLMQELISSVR